MLTQSKLVENQYSNVLEFNRHRTLDKFEYFHQKLTEIFDEEIFSENSIFVKVKKNAITKIALFLSGNIQRPASIGLSGETASGKSTIAMDIIEELENFSKTHNIKNLVTRINTDDYYWDKSTEVKQAGGFANFAKNYDFDLPQAIDLSLMKKHIGMLLENKPVYLPRYDMSGTAMRIDNHTLAEPSQVIISEGLFTLTETISDVFDFKIYVDVTRNIQSKRFHQRAIERGLGDSAPNVLENAISKALIYIRPSAFSADLIISGEADRIRYKEFLNKILNLVKEINMFNYRALF